MATRWILTAAVVCGCVLGAGCDTLPAVDGNDANDGTTNQPGVTGVIAMWDFEPTVVPVVGSLEASTVGDHVVTAPFTSFDGSPTTTFSQGVNWVTENGWFDPSTYLACTLQAEDGFEIQLTSVEFAQSTLAAGATSWALRSSVDNFADDLATGSVVVFPTFDTHSVDLTGINVGTASVEFRWFALGVPTGSNVAWGVDDVTFQGKIVPAAG